MNNFKATLRPPSINQARAKARAKEQAILLDQQYKAWMWANPEEYRQISQEGFNAAWRFHSRKPYHLCRYKSKFQVMTWQDGFQEGTYNYDVNN